MAMLFENYAASAGLFSNKTVADVSHKYDTLFAPAGYAFIIWGVIFLLTLGYVIYQWVLLKTNDSQRYVQRTGIWFTVSNVANTTWLYCWLTEQLGLSVICILILLASLIILTIQLRLELDDVPVRTIFFVWWPVTFYLGWIMLATIACIASWLTSINWTAFGISQSTWTIILIAISCLFYLGIILKRNMREAAAVGIWAFIAIAVRQWNDHVDIVSAALLSSSILAIAIAVHVYRNRKYNIGSKLKRGEW